MAQDNKKRRVLSIEKLNQDEALLAVFNEKYPGGANDCFDDIEKYPKPDGSSFYAITLETEDSICLIKIPVAVDSPDDIEKWLRDEEGAEIEQVAGTTGGDESAGSTIPEDGISDYSGADDDSSD